MPSWIEGTMKVRGNAKNVYRFFCEAFTLYNDRFEVDENGIYEWNHEADSSGVTIYKNDYFMYSEISIKDLCYIEGTKRAFVNGNTDVYFDDFITDEEVTKAINVKQAWGWEPENYKFLSDKYNIDIRLIGWENWMEYKGECEVLRGEEPVYTETEYDDWIWETECPLMGG